MISKLIEVARRDGPAAEEYRQTFLFETQDDDATVATALRELNERSVLTDVDGNQAEPIRWQCSCLQRKCGSCAMVVNGTPRAACDVRLARLRGRKVTLEPLRKFPVVADLVVDRHAVYDRLREAEVWLRDNVELPEGKRGSVAYEASRCLQCGCCLEVCPNFSTQGSFGGMAAMVPLSRLLAETAGADRDRLVASYRKAVHAGCGTSLACRNVCPAEIDIAGLMARSNAAILWRLR